MILILKQEKISPNPFKNFKTIHSMKSYFNQTLFIWKWCQGLKGTFTFTFIYGSIIGKKVGDCLKTIAALAPWVMRQQKELILFLVASPEEPRQAWFCNSRLHFFRCQCRKQRQCKHALNERSVLKPSNLVNNDILFFKLFVKNFFYVGAHTFVLMTLCWPNLAQREITLWRFFRCKIHLWVVN